MQRILGYMRKAIQEFDMIQDGDKIAVGVSGGKDSLVLLMGLILLKRFIGKKTMQFLTSSYKYGNNPACV